MGGNTVHDSTATDTSPLSQLNVSILGTYSTRAVPSGYTIRGSIVEELLRDIATHGETKPQMKKRRMDVVRGRLGGMMTDGIGCCGCWSVS